MLFISRPSSVNKVLCVIIFGISLIIITSAIISGWALQAGMEQRALYYPYIPHRHNNITSHNNIFCDKNHNEVYIMINFHILHTFYLCSTLFDHEMRKAVNVSLLYTSNTPLKKHMHTYQAHYNAKKTTSNN